MDFIVVNREFYNKKELAELTGLSVFTIDQWVSQQRELPFVRMGRRVMFRKSDVEAWIDMNTYSPRTDSGWMD